MKIFVSFRYTGETYESLVSFFRPLCDALKSHGHSVYCSLWLEEEYQKRKPSVGDMLREQLPEINKADTVLVIIRTNDRSEGMLMEVGYALAQKKPIYAAVAPGVQSYITDMATKSFTFTSTAQIVEQVLEEI